MGLKTKRKGSLENPLYFLGGFCFFPPPPPLPSRFRPVLQGWWRFAITQRLHSIDDISILCFCIPLQLEAADAKRRGRNRQTSTRTFTRVAYRSTTSSLAYQRADLEATTSPLLS